MAELTVQDAPVTGLDGINFTAADVAGDTVETGSGVALLVRNGDTVSHTATVEAPGSVYGLSIQDATLPVAASAQGAIPLVAGAFGSTASITYDDVTAVDVAAIRLAR